MDAYVGRWDWRGIEAKDLYTLTLEREETMFKYWMTDEMKGWIEWDGKGKERKGKG